jgi:hypothetical protein
VYKWLHAWKKAAHILVTLWIKAEKAAACPKFFGASKRDSIGIFCLCKNYIQQIAQNTEFKLLKFGIISVCQICFCFS